MKTPYGFIKTAGRGSAYCTQGGRHWIVKASGGWHLIQMGSQVEGRARELIGVFPTLTAAAEFYQQEVAA